MTQKMSSKNWTNKQYHAQHNKDVEHQDVKLYCDTNHVPELNFLGTHNKPHGVHELGKHCHMLFDTKIGHGTNAIRLCFCPVLKRYMKL